MKRLTLHIGTHKTGTTTLQRFMLLNAPLLEGQGLCAPKTPSKYPHKNQDKTACFLHYLALKDLEGEYPHKGLEDLVEADRAVVAKAAQANDHVYLSEERIWYTGAQDAGYWRSMRTVAEEIGFDEFRLVVYLRRQDQLAVSMWEQSAKRPSLTSSLNDYLETETLKNTLDYLKVLRDIEEVFGHESIVVRVFDRKTLIEGDICHDFCDAIGIQWDDAFEIPQDLNLSLPFSLAEVKRIANAAPSMKKTDGHYRHIAYQATLATQSMSSELSSVSAKEFKQLVESHRADNATVAREYVGQPEGDLFAPGKKKQQSLEAFSPEMLHDMCLFFSEAIAVEHDHNIKLKQQVTALEKRFAKIEAEFPTATKALKRIKRLENSYENSLFMKIERAIRGRDRLERKQ